MSRTALVILLLAAVFRIAPLADDVRFHPDEALFTSLARSVLTSGNWRLMGDLDKPPLSIYINAASLALIGVNNDRGVPDLDPHVGEFAARLPGVLAGLLWVAAVYALAKRLYGNDTLAAWAALFMACAPPAIAYSAAAYTDGWMLAFSGLALWMASADRPLTSGAFLAFAFLSKQQALYYLPLAFGFLLLPVSVNTRAAVIRRAALLLLPIAAAFGATAAWDALRRPSPPLFALAAANNSPGRLIRSDEVIPRLITWLEWGQFAVGAPTLFLTAFSPLAVTWRVRRLTQTREAAADLLIVLFIVGYTFVHWLIAFNTYDRYLLPIVPMLAILAARTGFWLWAMLSRWITRPELTVAAGAVVISLLTGARDTHSIYNAERYEQGDIIALADYLNALPTATIIYDHWLGWQLGYYLGAWNDKRRVYYPTADALAADAVRLTETEPRYFPAPASQSFEVWREALEGAGFVVERVYLAGSYTVYRLVPP